jgi:hypothetical protein
METQVEVPMPARESIQQISADMPPEREQTPIRPGA